MVFDRGIRTFINVGGGTAPETFQFRNNAWFEIGGGDGDRKPSLPTNESGGIYGIDPELRDAGSAKMAIGSKSPILQGIGADAFKRLKPAPKKSSE